MGVGSMLYFWFTKKDVPRSNPMVDWQALHAVMAIVAALVGFFVGTLNFAWISGP